MRHKAREIPAALAAITSTAWDNLRNARKGPATCEHDGFTLHVRIEADYEIPMEHCHVGTFGDKWQPGAIDRGPRARNNREYRYYYPEESIAALRAGYHRQGHARGTADAMARAQVYADKRAAETLGTEWNPFMVTVTAHRADVQLGCSALGGIDIGHDWRAMTGPDALHYLGCCVLECAGEAVADARHALARLCPAMART